MRVPPDRAAAERADTPGASSGRSRGTAVVGDARDSAQGTTRCQPLCGRSCNDFQPRCAGRTHNRRKPKKSTNDAERETEQTRHNSALRKRKTGRRALKSVAEAWGRGPRSPRYGTKRSSPVLSRSAQRSRYFFRRRCGGRLLTCSRRPRMSATNCFASRSSRFRICQTSAAMRGSTGAVRTSRIDMPPALSR